MSGTIDARLKELNIDLGSPAAPAFPHVRAIGFFTYGVQRFAAHHSL